MRLLECSELNMSYESVRRKDLSFHADEGDYLCIVGENGSGKTTLVKGLLGLMVPDSGRISYFGVKKAISGICRKGRRSKGLPRLRYGSGALGLPQRQQVQAFLLEARQKNCAGKHGQACDIRAGPQVIHGPLRRAAPEGPARPRALFREALILLDEPVASLDGRRSGTLRAYRFA